MKRLNWEKDDTETKKGCLRRIKLKLGGQGGDRAADFFILFYFFSLFFSVEI